MSDDTLNRVREIISETFNVDGRLVTADSQKKEIEGWDSLGHLRLMMAVEKTFEAKFLTSEITAVKTVGDIVKILETSS